MRHRSFPQLRANVHSLGYSSSSPLIFQKTGRGLFLSSSESPCKDQWFETGARSQVWGEKGAGTSVGFLASPSLWSLCTEQRHHENQVTSSPAQQVETLPSCSVLNTTNVLLSRHACAVPYVWGGVVGTDKMSLFTWWMALVFNAEILTKGLIRASAMPWT